MNRWDAALEQLRAEHDLSIFHEPGGCRWSCSCGREGRVPVNYPTELQARARGQRHLRAEHDRILAAQGTDGGAVMSKGTR